MKQRNMNKMRSFKSVSVSVSDDPVASVSFVFGAFIHIFYCFSPRNRQEYPRWSSSLFTAACPNGETRTLHFSQVLPQHANRKASVGAAQGPHRSFCCRMFGDVPPAQINAAVLLINYSWNTGHPASQPRIFSLFSFFFSSACSPCSACLHLADSRQKPGEQFVTKYSSQLLSVWGFSPFPAPAEEQPVTCCSPRMRHVLCSLPLP